MHYNEANSYILVNSVEIYKFKARNSEIYSVPLGFGNILKGFTVDNMKKTGLSRYFYDFSVDYDSTDVDDILDIYTYLTKKRDIK